ncbi:MAG: YARHG domain-containing protein [Bacteroidales bacterium]|nr:YARHG domain-containing protein [Bacteroidales bacterium]
MRNALILLSCAMATGMSAQEIVSGTNWYDGMSIFVASKGNGQQTVLESRSEGESTTIVLLPVTGESGRYYATWVDAEDDTETTFEMRSLAGKRILVEHDGENVRRVYSETTKSLEAESRDDWEAMIVGRYESDAKNAKNVTIDNGKIALGKDKCSYKTLMFNGLPSGVVEIAGKSEWAGTWMVEVTTEGVRLASCRQDENVGFEKDGKRVLDLRWADRSKSRWAFASARVLNSGIYRLSPEVLRLMRNAIMAAHGYSFESTDLKDYFASCGWYRPAESNNIQLTDVERLNVLLIQQMEKEKTAK